MQISPKVRKQLRWQNTTFVTLFLVAVALIGFLSTRYVYEADWTANNRNTPSKAAIGILKKLNGPIKITAFVSNNNEGLRTEIKHIVSNFKRQKSDIELNFLDPSIEPARVRELGVTADGELILEYQNRKESVLSADEQSITNAMQRLGRDGERLIVFIEGHKERSPFGTAHYDYANWSKQLQNRGFKIKPVNLAADLTIPSGTSVVVLTDPQQDFIAGELAILQDYIDQGGNLLWLAEPGDTRKLDPLSEQLGIDMLPGTIIDTNVQLLGVNDPRFALVSQYPQNAITFGLTSSTLFPGARALEFTGSDEWEPTTLLETLPRTWAELDDHANDFTFDQGQDLSGPLAIGLSLVRTTATPVEEVSDAEKEVIEPFVLENKDEIGVEPLANETPTEKIQRVVIIGDADFLSDAYLGQGSNQELGFNVINWLSNDDAFLNLPIKTTVDAQLSLSPFAQTIITLNAIVIIPSLLIGFGVTIWVKRRRT